MLSLPENVSSPYLKLEASGPGGGAWRIVFDGAQPVAAERGIDPSRPIDVYVTTNALSAIAAGEMTIEQAASSGRLILFHDNLSDDDLTCMLETLFGWLTTQESIVQAAAIS
jgi:hypothetical protein